MVTFTIKRIKPYFTQAGYEVSFWEEGKPYARPVRLPWGDYMLDKEPVRFYGSDGRKERAAALAFARNVVKERKG